MMITYVENVLGHFPGHKPAGKDKWKALCPAHEDHNPSLSIGIGDKGDILLHCFGGCAVEDIVRDAGLEMSELFPDQGNGFPHSTDHQTAKPNRAAATPEHIKDFRLCNADGQVTAIHRRIDMPNGKKRFQWLHPDGQASKNGEIASEDQPLFGAQFLPKRPSDPVIVCEGETAAQALQQKKILAVGTVTGASGPSANASLAVLKGRDTLLWPDNDDAGRRHMHRIAERLIEQGTQPRLISWPDAPPKGDAADFVKQHGQQAREALSALFATAVPWQPALPDGLRCLADVQAGPVSWFWHPYIPLGKFTILEGDPGVGKSYLTAALSTATSLGRGLPGVDPTEPASVLLYAAEDGLEDTIRPRLDAMGADVRRILARDVAFALTPEGLQQVETDVQFLRPRLVILDPLDAYFAGDVDLHRSNQVREVLSVLIQLARTYDFALLGLRHLTKAPGGKAIYRGQGSIAFTAAARSVILAGRDDSTGEYGIVHTKHNLSPKGDAIGYEIRDERFLWTGPTTLTEDRILAIHSGGDGTSALQEAEEFLREALAEGERPRKEIEQEAEECGIKPRTLRRAREKLRIHCNPQVETGRRGASAWLWSLPLGSVDHDGQVNEGDLLDQTSYRDVYGQVNLNGQVNANGTGPDADMEEEWGEELPL